MVGGAFDDRAEAVPGGPVEPGEPGAGRLPTVGAAGAVADVGAASWVVLGAHPSADAAVRTAASSAPDGNVRMVRRRYRAVSRPRGRGNRGRVTDVGRPIFGS